MKWIPMLIYVICVTYLDIYCLQILSIPSNVTFTSQDILRCHNSFHRDYQCKKLKERLIDATEQTHFEHRVTAKLIYCRDGKKRHLQNEAHKLHVKAFAYDNK